MGRPRKSNPLKAFGGDAGRRGAGSATVPFVSAEIGPPRWLVGDLALEEWEKVSKSLKQDGRLAMVDQAALAMYCDSLSLYIRASINVQSKGYVVVGGHGSENPSPWLKIMHDAYVRFVKLATEFGFTTAAREKLAPAAPPVDPKRAKFFGS